MRITEEGEGGEVPRYRRRAKPRRAKPWVLELKGTGRWMPKGWWRWGRYESEARARQAEAALRGSLTWGRCEMRVREEAREAGVTVV